MQTPTWEVNAAIGDYSAIFSKRNIHPLNDKERIQTHLFFVCDYLQSAPIQHLNRQQKINRRLVINALRCYAREGVFPLHQLSLSQRRPRFIDHRGVHCAVGELIKYTDGHALPERVNDRHEYDYIGDIHVSEVAIWAHDNGLSLDECTMIQPQYLPPADEILKELCPWISLTKGTELEQRTEALRKFRDQRLMQSSGGRLLVRSYYKTGPSMIRIFEKYPWSQEPVRNTLKVITKNLK